MIAKIPSLRITGAHSYMVDYPSGDYTLFSQPLNETAQFAFSDVPIYENSIPFAYGRWYLFEDNGLTNNLIYDISHNGRYHLYFKGLKYLSNISDLWYMNSILVGYNNNPNPIFGKNISAVSLQSFANINLAVDAVYLSMDSIKPAGKTLDEGLFESSDPGIRLVMFVDKLDLVDRTVGAATIKNLQFHFTLKAYLVDPSLGGQYEDFTATSLLGQKSFYYEQTVPTYVRSNFSTKNSLKTGWGHFIYPLTTNDTTAITYVQLSDVLKTVYNAMIFAQSTDNVSLRVNSTSLLSWLNADITLRNAADTYTPSSVIPNQPTVPAFGFTEANVLKNWLATISSQAAVKGSPSADFLLSYDNIYWEPLADLYTGDVYSNSPAIFMTRLTTYYQGTGQSPIDEPGNFENPGGFIKSRRKYFLSNLIQYVASKSSVDKNQISPYLETENPERFLGSKFFPFYKFKQYKNNTSGKELLDLITVPFSSAETVTNIIECETSTDLKKVVPDSVNQYRKKIVTKQDLLPSSLGSTTTERINTIGYVEYVNNDGISENIQLNLSAGTKRREVFAFLTWIYLAPSIIGETAQWTKDGRYFTYARDLETKLWLGYDGNRWSEYGICEIINSGMYDTPELAYRAYKRVIEKIYVYSDPSPSNPEWKDFYKCLPSTETIEETTEYCDPSPSPDGRQVIKRIKKQRVSTTAAGVKTNVGNPTYDYPVTTIILKNQSQVINGTTVLGDRTIVYKECGEFSNTFTPYPVSPTGPVIKTGPDGNKKREVDLSLENFINPAVFKINTITLSPSEYPIPLVLVDTYYKIDFDPDDIGEESSDYTIRLFPGKRGQVLVLEINTIGTQYKGVKLINGDILANNKSSQRTYISTDVWGDGDGSPFKSYLFLLYDGNDWIEFLRRDIY